jgi:hypothetical protein
MARETELKAVFSIHAEIVEELLGQVPGVPKWKIDAISDEPHGKKLWQRSVEGSRKIREIWMISPRNNLTEVMREAGRPIPPICKGGGDAGQAIGGYAAIRMDGMGRCQPSDGDYRMVEDVERFCQLRRIKLDIIDNGMGKFQAEALLAWCGDRPGGSARALWRRR